MTGCNKTYERPQIRQPLESCVLGKAACKRFYGVSPTPIDPDHGKRIGRLRVYPGVIGKRTTLGRYLEYRPPLIVGNATRRSAQTRRLCAAPGISVSRPHYEAAPLPERQVRRRLPQ